MGRYYNVKEVHTDWSVMATITEEQFQAYVEVQRSGVTNMWDVRRVMEEAEGVLTYADVATIMKTYGRLTAQYPNIDRGE